MIDINPCPKCGNSVLSHVNYYGFNRYRYYVECTNCCLEWTSKKYNTVVRANREGLKSWNNNYWRIKKKGNKHESK